MTSLVTECRQYSNYKPGISLCNCSTRVINSPCLLRHSTMYSVAKYWRTCRRNGDRRASHSSGQIGTWVALVSLLLAAKERNTGKCKGQVHHGRGHEGPEGKQRYSYALSLTSALDGGGWSTPRPSCFIPGKETRYPLCRRLGAHQGRSEHRRKTSPSPGFDPPTVQPVASRYNNYSIPAHIIEKCKSKDAMYQENKLTRKRLVRAKRGERRLPS